MYIMGIYKGSKMGKTNDQKSRGNTLIKPSVKSVGNFLVEDGIIIKIPPNQRPYAWEEKQIDEFLNDLAKTREQKYKSGGEEYWHYFNMVTYVRDKENPKQVYIHDGQQRVTTTFITLVYLLSKYKEKMPKYNIDKMPTNMEKFADCLKVNDSRKLCMFAQNDELIAEMYNLYNYNQEIKVTELKANLSKKNCLIESNKRIIRLLEKIDSSKYTKDYIEDMIGIDQLFNSLYSNFEVVRGELANSHQAYKIFELVNNRGKSLSQIDLIKNYFYQIADKSERKADLADLEQMLGNIISKLGDDFEDAIIKHWLLYFNDSNNTLHGKPNDIELSILNKVESYKSHSEKRDLIFEFLNNIEHNIEFIATIYQIFKLSYADFKHQTIVEAYENNNFDVELLKKVVVQRDFANNEFEYLDYYLYYLLFEYQKSECAKTFKLIDEYQKAVNFYVYRSIVKDGKIALDKLNYRLGQRIKAMNELDLNEVFVKFLLEENDGEQKNYKQLLKGKLEIPQQEIADSRAKLLFQLCYGLDDINKLYEENNGRVDKIELEHILPKSSQRKNFEQYDSFNLTSKDSLYKNKIEWLGNKLLLSKSKNIEVSNNFEEKLNEYSYNSTLYLNQEYFIILTREYLDGNKTKQAILNHKRTDYIKEIIGKIRDNSEIENEKIMNTVEEKWRLWLANYIFENDIFKLDNWNNIEELGVTSSQAEGKL